MRLLLDQNISHRILKSIEVHYPESISVKGKGLMNASDRDIWEYAKKNDYIIVTYDSDFNDLNSLFGFPPKIIWIRTGNIKSQELVEILLAYYNEIERFWKDLNYGCFEILKSKKE